MKVSFEVNAGKQQVVNNIGAEVKVVEELVKVDARQELWDELDAKGIEYKKNMSKAKLESLLK